MGYFVYTSTEAQALSLRGGYTPGCSTRTLDSTNTKLDGNNHTGSVLQPSAGALTANFRIEGLTIRNGSFGLSASNGSGGEVRVENNHIRDNSAGGVSLSATTATLTNNTLQGNAAGAGGGISVRFQGPASPNWVAFYNNLFWQNQTTGNSGADFYIENSLASQVTLFANNFDWTPTIGFLVGTPIYLDASNLDKVDPLFVDITQGDLHLMPASPMINAGYPATPDLPDFDLDGTPRVLGASVDIGAYEYDGSDPKAILSLVLAGTGSGTVTSAPTGIACGSDCFHAYDLDTLVTLAATPTDGNSVFAGWGGDADCEDGQVTLSTHVSCTFTAVRQLTVARQGLGGGLVTSNPTGIDCGVACQAPFYLAERVQLTATPDAVSTFVGWSGDAACPNPILDVNRSCTATFDPKLYRLYVFVAGGGGGTVTSAPAGIQCGTDCAEDYVANTRVTLTATPAATSTFAGWTGPCTGIDPTCEVTMSQIQGVAAIFNLKTYPLTVTKRGTGQGIVTSIAPRISTAARPVPPSSTTAPSSR